MLIIILTALLAVACLGTCIAVARDNTLWTVLGCAAIWLLMFATGGLIDVALIRWLWAWVAAW